MKFKEIWENEFIGWKKLEVSWLLIACAVIVGLSIYWQDSLMGIISATTGVACVVCTGKAGGKRNINYIITLAYKTVYHVFNKSHRRKRGFGENLINRKRLVKILVFQIYAV